MRREGHPHPVTARPLCRALAVAIALCACHKADPQPPTKVEDVRAGSASATAAPPAGAASSGTGSMQSRLAVKLLASPTQLRMAERSKFMIGVEVINHGTTVVDPKLSRCRLTVNGEPSMAWNLAIGNGAREPTWTQLPPGETATMSWPLGIDLFDKPGDYHLVMTLGDQQSTADIHVTR
jgi:hypothetical protein